MSSLNFESEKSEENSKNANNSKINGSQNKSLIDKSKSNIPQNNKDDEDNEVFSDASFSLSKVSDIDSLHEAHMNKSNDGNLNFEYESTLQNAEEDLSKEVDLQFTNMAKNEPGFDNDIKKISSSFYNTLVNSITGGKSQNNQKLDKTNLGYTKYGSIISGGDEQTIKLKNDLSGVPVILGPDISNITGNIVNTDKKKSQENNENEFIIKDSNSKIMSKESSSGVNGKYKLDYKKTMSLEYSKEKESFKKEMISSSSQNKQSSNKQDSKISKNAMVESQK